MIPGGKESHSPCQSRGLNGGVERENLMGMTAGRTFAHAEDRGKGFLGMVERAISIVENADPVPEFGVLLGGGVRRRGK